MFRKLSITAAAATFLLVAPSCSEAQNKAAVKDRGSAPISAQVASEKPKATPNVSTNRERLIAEAVSALQETQTALLAINEGQRDKALEALARATGKLEILLAREPGLALAPVDVSVVTRDVIADKRALQSLRDRAEQALRNGHLQDARHLIADLASETALQVSNLPLATYPAALRSAAAQLERNQLEAAAATLQTALSTVVVQETIYPLPIHRAGVALREAKTLAEKANRTDAENQRLALAIGRAREEIQLGQALGYGDDTAMRQMVAEIDQIQAKTSGKKSGRGFFDRIDSLLERTRESSPRQTAG
jgi:hypothetical protein